MVSRFGGRQRPLLGGCAGHQAADAAGNQRPVVYVLSGSFECAVPLEPGGWRDADSVSARGNGIDTGGPPKGSYDGVGVYERGREEEGGIAAFAVSGDAASGETDVPILHPQRSPDGWRFHVRGRIDRARAKQFSFKDHDERKSYETGAFL